MSLRNSDVENIIYKVRVQNLKTKTLARLYGVSQRRIQQLVKEYYERGRHPVIHQRGRKPKDPNENLHLEVVRAKSHLKAGSNTIARYIRKNRGLSVDNNEVHRILIEEGMAEKDPRKCVRKKPWIRYERNHSLSAVHMDWHFSKVNGSYVCAVLDDASRMILAAGEFDNLTAEHSIKLLDLAYHRYSHIRPIHEVITDHGSQFYANKRDKDGFAAHSFENYCRQMGIHHILCKYNHPQSNGKIEKWFDLYNRKRDEFDSFEEMIVWYNSIRPHLSLNVDALETPEQAFYRKCEDIILGNFIQWIDQTMEAEI